MAHTCPDCGQACYCSGDCEDHDTGDEYADDCNHFLKCAPLEFMDDEGGGPPEDTQP